MKTTPRFWSNVFDALIVLADFFVGSLVAPHFFSLFEGESASGINNAVILCVVMLILLGLYMTGLFINRVNFRAEEPIKLSGADNVVMLFNVLLMGGIVPVIMMELVPEEYKTVQIILIVFAFVFMFVWGWLHWYILRKESAKSGGEPSQKRKIFGFFLVFPFVAFLSAPISAMTQEMKLFSEGDAITLINALWWPLFVGFLLALLSLFLYFIPRKMLKGFMGVNIKSRAFFWALVIDYAFRLSPFNFFHT
ncbi:hypothetical protein SDC9_61225 [bioreactor metagenome]|uniref:Uncharacterized protein n=1 Tax=bioreactor metagenome TaxID=1076179 RepID=A0A644XGH5_9ZZZZ